MTNTNKHKTNMDILGLARATLIWLFALFMSVGNITNRMRRIRVEVQHHKHFLFSHSEPPLANLKHYLISHIPFTTKLKVCLNWGFSNQLFFNIKFTTLKIQVRD